MPIYEYRCDNGHTFEVIQRMSDDPVATCEVCGEPVARVFHPVAVHFKGSGFYSTDYGKKRGGGGSSDGGPSKEDSSKSESSESGESGSSESASSSDSDSKKSDTASDANKSDSKSDSS
jgi:putative FmdB family regulatory protein